MNARTAFAAVLLMCPSIAAAQTADANRVDRPGIAFSPAVTATSGVDTNVFHEGVNPVSDLVLTVSPSLATSIRWGRLAITGRGRAGFVHFQASEGERSIDTAADTRLDLLLRHVHPFVAANFLNTRQRPDFEIDARARRIEESFTGGVNVPLTGKTSFEVSMNVESRRFDAGAVFLGTYLSESLNRDSTTFAAGMHMSVTPLTTIAVKALVSSEQYPTASFRNLQTVRIEPGLYFSPRAAISGHASFGYRRSVPLGTGPTDGPEFVAGAIGGVGEPGAPISRTDVAVPRLDAFAGPVAAVDVAYRIWGGTTATVSVERDLTQSFRLDLPTYVFTEVGGGILHEMAGHWRVRASLRRQRYDYRTSADVLLNLAREQMETVLLGHAGLEYRPRRNAGMEFGLDRYVRHSTVSTRRDVRGLQFGVSFTYGLY